MAKELPFFKFEPGQWDNGRIQMCSFEAQGIFINICAMYWHRLGDLPYKLVLQKICKGNSKLLEPLIEESVIVLEGENIIISFLDEQLQEFSEIREKRVEAGKKGGKNRSLRPEIERVQGKQFYVIHCYNATEDFIKFGITDDSISRRFSGKIPYEYETLFQLSTEDHLLLESACCDGLRQYLYRPKQEFPGYLECYDIAVLSELSNILKQRTGFALASLKPRNAIRGEEKREDKMIEEKKVNGASYAATIEERGKIFYGKLKPFLEEFGADTLRKFFDYWSEHSDGGRKMRFEKEKVFDIKKRLTTWKNREQNGTRNGTEKSIRRSDATISQSGGFGKL